MRRPRVRWRRSFCQLCEIEDTAMPFACNKLYGTRSWRGAARGRVRRWRVLLRLLRDMVGAFNATGMAPRPSQGRAALRERPRRRDPLSVRP